ncbi:hypothetical protein GOODEAATRI_004907 [Goodea atripinnis]|uniref:Uncharacterized protein n=1 Tax=Goodea atripinnis TaxID=208336 RepID=A0ABV0P3G7_9TELE
MHSSLYSSVFSHRFVLTNADYYVLKYLESISSQIPSQTLDSLRQKLGVEMARNKPVEENGYSQPKLCGQRASPGFTAVLMRNLS